MLRRLYDWTIEKAESPYALVFLAMLAFAESSFFPIPQEALMIPMIVFLFYDTIGVQVLEFYGKADRYDEFKALYDQHGSWAVAIGAITPFPYKVTTIVSGLLQMDFLSFMVVSLIGRGVRFFLIAALLWKLD